MPAPPTHGESGKGLNVDPAVLKQLGVSTEEFGAQAAAGKAVCLLQLKSESTFSFEKALYGAAIALPQYARTSGWSLHYTAFAFRSYLFLGCNFLLQGFLVYMIAKEERVNDKFGGQMHLCDFGAHIQNCPDGPNCIGPRGTGYTPARLYNWNMWATRVFIRQSFEAMFPERMAEINEKVDPGEYGLESYWLRATCCFIFVIGLWPDLVATRDLCQLLLKIPTSSSAWIQRVVSEGEEVPGAADQMDLVKFRISGMPRHWKLANFFLVIFPKLYLWILTVDIGILFLMETASIEDMVINAVALAFILNLDEIIYEAMFSDAAKDMLSRLEDYEDINYEEFATPDDMEIYMMHQENRQWNLLSPRFYMLVFPVRMFAMISVLAFFLLKYYMEHCVHLPDGSFVGKDLHLPSTYTMSFFSFIFGPVPKVFPVPVDETASWSFSPVKPTDYEGFSEQVLGS